MKLNVKEYVAKNKEILKKEIVESGLKPKLTIIKNNNDPRSDAYVRNKIKDCGIQKDLELEKISKDNRNIETVEDSLDYFFRMLEEL